MSKKNSKKSKPLIEVKKRFMIFNNADGESVESKDLG